MTEFLTIKILSDVETAIYNQTELADRISSAKRYVNSEINRVKSTAADNYKLHELGLQLDQIHEAERIGVRNLQEREFARIRRVLTSIEARMALSSN